MRFFRRKRDVEENTLSLSITSENDDTWIEYPAEVAAGIQQAVTRIVRVSSFPQRLVITSAVRQEGVTYLSRAIGAVLAKDFGQKTCVVELNWWWPADDPKALSNRPGVADVLHSLVRRKRNGSIPDALDKLEEVVLPTGLGNLSLVPAGRLEKNLRATYASSPELSIMLDELGEQFDSLILDVPAVTAASEAIVLASIGAALCLVVNQGVTPVQRVRATLDDLDHLNIVGVIMNQVTISTPSFLLDYLAQE